MDSEISTQIVAAVARHKNVDPTALPPLNRVVDGDAIDALFVSAENGTEPGQRELRFTYADRDVRVTPDGVSVHPPGTLLDSESP